MNVLVRNPHAHALRRLHERLIDHLEPPDRRPIGEWASCLTLTSGDYAGQPFSIERVPHAKLIFDFFEDPNARELHIRKSSAAAFSTSIFVSIVHTLKFRPCNVLYAINNQDEMRKLSITVLQPFLRDVFGDVLFDEDEQSNLFLRVNGAHVYLGSPTEGFFRNKQIAVGVLDEYDLMPDKLMSDRGGAAGEEPLEALRIRARHAVRWRKLITLCAPLVHWTPDVPEPQAGQKQTIAWYSGDRREYRVPCPHCGFEQVLRREGKRYAHCRKGALPGQEEMPLDDPEELPPEAFDIHRVLRETYYECEFCRRAIHEGEEKRRMVSAGRWVPTAEPAKPGVWSAHYTDLNALIGDSSWGTIQLEEIEARRRGKSLVSVLRNRYGIGENPLAETGAMELDHLKLLRGDFPRLRLVDELGAINGPANILPIDPLFCAYMVDVQQSSFKWGLYAFTERAIYVADYGELPKNFTLLPALVTRPLRSPNGWTGLPHMALIDSAHWSADVLEFVAKTRVPGQNLFCPEVAWMPWLGIPRVRATGQKVQCWLSPRKVYSLGVEVQCMEFDSQHYQAEMYEQCLHVSPPDKNPAAHPRVWFPADADDAFLREFTNERKVAIVSKNSATLYEYQRVNAHRSHDYADTTKVARVFYDAMMIQMV